MGPAGKEPHALGRGDGAPVALGAIWECWRRRGADRRRTLSIVTTPATQGLAHVHDRMPLVLEPEAWAVWLGEEEGDASALMRPAEPGRISAWRIGDAVGDPRNDGPDILREAA